jgi:hypothetical protein
MGAGACVGDARGRMRQGLPSMPDQAIGGRGWRDRDCRAGHRDCPAGEGERRDCRVEYPSGVVQGKGAGRAGSHGWKPARPGDQGAAAMDWSRQSWLEVLWTRFATDLADRRDLRPARGERQNRAPILSVDAYVRYISSSREVEEMGTG